MIKKRMGGFILIAILLLVGCQAKDDDANKNALLIEVNQKYLVTNIGSAGFGGAVSCAYEPLNAEQGVDDKIFLWVVCLEYYMEDGNLTIGTGSSLPVVLHIQQKNGSYEIVDHLIPRDGTYYAEDIYDNFPESSWPQIFHDVPEFNDRIEELAQDLENRANLYFRD